MNKTAAGIRSGQFILYQFFFVKKTFSGRRKNFLRIFPEPAATFPAIDASKIRCQISRKKVRIYKNHLPTEFFGDKPC